MKSASVQHIDHFINNKIYTTNETVLRTLINVNTNIMKKLTNISPFILLLVPVFMMMILTIATSVNPEVEGMSAAKTTTNTSVAKIPVQRLK